jgi:transcriptional regulator with XRE-family HTH domain
MHNFNGAPEDDASMSARIKEARQARGWSQQELAERVSVSQPTIVHWEQGTHIPRHLALARLADALGVSRQWLQGDIENNTLVAQSRTTPYHKNPTPILSYLNSPINHVPVFAGPLDKEEVEACLKAQRTAIAYIPVSIPVISPIGFVIDDGAIEKEFPKNAIGIIECADRSLIDGKVYLINLNGVAKIRRWGAYPARFDADRPDDVYLVNEPPEVIGRLLVTIRQY